MSISPIALGSLPNLHPAVVHFPVALILLGLVVELLRLIRPSVLLDKAGTALQPAAALTAWAAFLAGRSAAGGLGPLPPQAESVLATHADLALWTAMVATATALLRLAVFPHPARTSPERRSLVHLLVLAGAIASSLLVGVTADHGGLLVYAHAVAVNRPTAAPVAVETGPPASPAAPRISRDAEGVLRWEARSTDAGALGSAIPVRGAVTAVASAGGPGLVVSATGPAIVCLGERLGDGVLAATLDPSGFSGRYGLAHHAQSASTAIVFSVDGEGGTRLARLIDGSEDLWDSVGPGAVGLSASSAGHHHEADGGHTAGGTESGDPPAAHHHDGDSDPAEEGGGPGDHPAAHHHDGDSTPDAAGAVVLSVSAAGHHHKGFAGDELLVHGHGDSGPAGCAGVWLDGTGELRIVTVSFSPVNGH